MFSLTIVQPKLRSKYLSVVVTYIVCNVSESRSVKNRRRQEDSHYLRVCREKVLQIVGIADSGYNYDPSYKDSDSFQIIFYLFIQYFQRVALLAIQPVYQVALYNTIKHIHTNIYKHVQNIYI